jgi:hypothetical protein
MTTRLFEHARADAVLAAVALALSIAACTSDDGAAPAADASVDAIAVDPCSVFSSSGAECPAVSPKVCFAECATGGCSCVATPAGPRWKCVTDLSCFPDARPVDLDARVAEPDASPDTDAADASDASDASDGAADGGAADVRDAADARADGPG